MSSGSFLPPSSASFALALFALLSPAVAAEATHAKIEYNRDVRPILSNTCFKCHGPDVKNNQSGLRLDVAEIALAPHRNKAGRVSTALVPGQPDASEVWRRLTSKDAQTVMPPPDALHQVSASEQAVIKRWIEQGARYQPHWAYTPVAKPALPATAAEDAPIDRFVRAELTSRHLAPSPEADRRTLIRRLSLDVIGLPPTPAETSAFLQDTQPGAYERLVDRLLASPHYGERMAAPWLDLVRFADSVGFHGDQEQNVFPYRDYVIDSFNRNRPFDQFTIEQLAGDLLPNATIEQRVASGFNRLNMMTREGGAQPQEYLAKYAADRVRTVATTWLGSTLACAECHDHKYDPFSTRDFYTMSAYFADIKQWGVYNDYGYTPEPELEGWSNDYPFPPEIEVDSPTLQRRARQYRAQLDQVAREQGERLVADRGRAAALQSWISQVAPRVHAEPGGWAPARPLKAASTDEIAARIQADGSILLESRLARTAASADDASAPKTKPLNRHVVELAAPAGPLSTLRLEALPDPSHEGWVTRARKTRFNARLTLALLRAGQSKPTPLPVAYAFPDGPDETYFNGKALPSVSPVWRSARARVDQPQAAIYHLQQPVTLAEGDRLIATLVSAEIGRFRYAVSPLGGRLPSEAPAPDVLAAWRADRPDASQQLLLAAEYVRSMGETSTGLSHPTVAQMIDLADCRGGRTTTMVTVATAPLTTRVLPRGNWQDQSGAVVLPAPPHFLPSAAAGSPGSRATRLDLARWIVSRDNPLTARTFVNRLWRQFFGTGLSAVVDDLGLQGEYPSHPELLDWLAADFMERGWDVKAMVRQMVTSATYRQASTYRPELADLDPDNRLLARQNARRLDAEFVRDNALAAAGLLNPELGGPSARPYQPVGYYEPINFPQREYAPDVDDRQYRRGVYMHWQRTFLHPMLGNFDASSREECSAARSLSTTPQQALTLLNDPTFVEAARALAEHLLSVPAPQRLDLAFQRLLARPPTDQERASLQSFEGKQRATFTAQPADAAKLIRIGLRPVPAAADPVELATWTSVARVLINLNETIVRY